jgi:hypothetical protein
MDGSQHPAAHGLDFGPGRRSARAGLVAQPLAAGLQAQAGAREVAMGRIDVWASYKVLNSTIYDYLPSFRRLFDEFLHSFDEFHLVFDFYSD